MSVHNRMSFDATPHMVNLAEFFELFDDAARGFKESVETNDLQKAAECLQVMTRLDHWFAEHRFEC